MSSYDEAVDCLKQMHSLIRGKNLPAYNLDRETFNSLDQNERRDLERNIQFMRDEGWIIPYTLCVGLPVSYSLTSLGIRVAEDIAQKQTTRQNTYHIVNAQNSIIGDNPHGNTINVGISFDELKSLIEQNISSQNEKIEILDTLKQLQNDMSSGKPLEKGFFTNINNKLQNCSWLSSGIAGLVIRYLSNL